MLRSFSATKQKELILNRKFAESLLNALLLNNFQV